MKVARRSAVPPFAVMEILAAAKARRAAGKDVIILCAGEPSEGAPAAVRERAAALLTDGDLGYTEATGTPDLKAELARHYRDTYAAEIPADAIAITTGSSGAFLLAFLAAFEHGDRVALARPGYPAYADILTSLGCEVVDLPCGPDQRYQPTVDQLAQEGPFDGLVLASPANPTGTMVTPDELAAIAAWCADTGTRLVSDEIYHGITYAGAPEAATAAAFRDSGAIVVSSFSKFWGMTGWRLGWLVLPDDLVGPVSALAGNLALCPPTLSQHAALAAFDDDGMAAARAATARYARCRDLLLAARDRLRWDPVAPADGAFYLYGDISFTGLDAQTYCERLLDEAGVALTPGTDFDPAGGRDWVRLSFAVAPDELGRAIDRIVAWQDGLTIGV
ncbi:MAG: aminotransferase class I/II-fold pyridoxal phosphate-dependent enzyme [Cellulomonas sp.]|uniref:pyridoxal phosphate-dependent aminotransferase n=1 Tax=Cellulomonas sp. 73-92 TaxID=1895740 RepID=UPI00092CCC84|nr:aminotransferase class I/II-fold pyridoxal phosphate-dependent enzyme [Cellulomonas sp. 73-92]MBN9375455.1 aminotransferase class I/II-fold pyridoxal phosphate-dependent enzyme [Cellulomonas sp.]OJV80986.1 MAG: aspartate aminotransferase [Cellulomonas sp. 73-92]